MVFVHVCEIKGVAGVPGLGIDENARTSAMDVSDHALLPNDLPSLQNEISGKKTCPID